MPTIPGAARLDYLLPQAHAAMRDHSGLFCQLLTDGRAGNLAQAVGLATALGARFQHHRVDDGGVLRRFLPRRGENVADLVASRPELILSCGGRAARIAAALRKRVPESFFVHIQNPRIAPEAFDLVVAPVHDGFSGANVLTTQGSLGLANRKRLDEAATQMRAKLADLQPPLIAVLLGGNSRARRLDGETAAGLAAEIAAMARRSGATLLTTTSRRTGPVADIFRSAFAPLPGHFWTWRDGRDDNPYLGYLGCADMALVTEDSVNMTSEACATGKPVYLLPLPPRGLFRGRRLKRFHQDMRDSGYCRLFNGRLESWDYPPLDETARIAAIIRQHMALRKIGRRPTESA